MFDPISRAKTLARNMLASEAEPCDRNKTDLTRRVTAGAAAWLTDRGFKPVETEVSVAAGWVADLAGVIVPTPTERIRLKLYQHSSPGWDLGVATAIVEVKTTRADFRCDDKWGRVLPSDLAWVAVPVGLLAPDEYPDGWGVLLCNPEDGTVRKVARPAPLRVVPLEQRLALVLAVAMRRDNVTRYARLREIERQRRASNNENVSRSRVHDCIRGVLAVVKGQHGSAGEAMRFHGVRSVPAYIGAELESLWGMMARAAAKEGGGGGR